ncbi:MAG: relaxase domain-containing protein [Microthrixaceae bacterium]|nr:relaxase domain-containing protein [Microthrixaceae bacterium]
MKGRCSSSTTARAGGTGSTTCASGRSWRAASTSPPFPARPGRTLGDPAAYYLEVIANECDDYYLSSGEAPGRWIGAGSERLGLTGEVKADAPRSVIEGVEPSSGEPSARSSSRPATCCEC